MARYNICERCQDKLTLTDNFVRDEWICAVHKRDCGCTKQETIDTVSRLQKDVNAYERHRVALRKELRDSQRDLAYQKTVVRILNVKVKALVKASEKWWDMSWEYAQNCGDEEVAAVQAIRTALDDLEVKGE